MILWTLLTIISTCGFVLCNEYDVVIVGAGVSGLSAGKYLKDQSVENFIILEAQDYIGGRMKKGKFANESIELGAGWIHGSDNTNSMFRLAEKYSLKRFDDYGDTIYRYKRNGSKVDGNLVNKRAKSLLKLSQSASTLVEQQVNKGGVDIDLATSLRRVGFTPKDALDYGLVFNYYQMSYGMPPDVLSTIPSAVSPEENTGYEQIVTDTRGYIYPILEETKSFHNKIMLNTVVKKIERLSSNKFTITTASGSTYTSKFVLVTVSSGVLIEDVINFTPPLPDWKKEAVNMVPMTHYCKIFLQFSDSFWDTNTNFIVFATMLDQKYIHWQNFDRDGLLKGKSILLATLVGHSCRTSHILTDEDIKNQVYEALKLVYPNASKPIEILRNDFSSNPFVRGAYSYQVPGITENHYLSLEHPVQQRLYFAGEYLGRWNFGSAHTAYDVGKKVAESMVSCLKNGECATDQPKFAGQCSKALGRSDVIAFHLISFVAFFLTMLLCT